MLLVVPKVAAETVEPVPVNKLPLVPVTLGAEVFATEPNTGTAVVHVTPDDGTPLVLENTGTEFMAGNPTEVVFTLEPNIGVAELFGVVNVLLLVFTVEGVPKID